MDVKTVLFLSIHVCISTATLNGSADVNHKDTRTVTGPAGRSFAVSRGSATKTDYESIFGNKNCSDEDLVFLSFSVKRVKECNRTDGKKSQENQTDYKISVEAVTFLKGPLFTRFMPSFYILIILISLPLNALAFVTFTCKIREKKPPAIYMSQLACVDLLFTLVLPLKIHYQLNSSDWVFGEAACRIVSAAYYCYMYCSILLVMCMSVDRLLAVSQPVASLSWRTPKKATLVCTLAWLLAFAGTVPLLSIKQTFNIQNVGITCHDALSYDEKDLLYMIVFFILSSLYYFAPLIVTFVSYFIIIYVLSSKSAHFTISSASSDKRRRAVIMSIIVLIEFVVCFAPTNGILVYHCVRLITGGKNGEGDSSYSFYLLAVCLGSASVFLDPLLYYYGSSQCRQKIFKLNWRRGEESSTSQSNTFTSIMYKKGVQKDLKENAS